MEIVKRTLCMILTAALLACFPAAEAAGPESREDYQLRIPTEENLSENERRLDDMLTRMKQEADQLYPSTVPYAIIDWEGSPVHEELYRFCRELPKGGDLHVHDDKVIPVSRFIRILKERAGKRRPSERGALFRPALRIRAPRDPRELGPGCAERPLGQL